MNAVGCPLKIQILVYLWSDPNNHDVDNRKALLGKKIVLPAIQLLGHININFKWQMINFIFHKRKAVSSHLKSSHLS